MRTRAENAMGEMLRQTGLYTVGEGGPVDCELKAYGEGFARIEQMLDTGYANLFVRSCTPEELDRRELCFRPQTSLTINEYRREMLIAREGARETDWSLESLSRRLAAAGIRGMVREDAQGVLQVYVAKELGVNEAEVLRELDELLPAHLSWELKKVLNWGVLDNLQKTFAQIESKGMTWQQIDTLTYEQVKEDTYGIE